MGDEIQMWFKMQLLARLESHSGTGSQTLKTLRPLGLSVRVTGCAVLRKNTVT